jgi:hypothetical protein
VAQGVNPDFKPQYQKNFFKILARHWWLTPVILATQEAETRQITVQSQPWKIVCETLSEKYPTQKVKRLKQ